MQKLATQNVVWNSLSQFRCPSRAWGQLAVLAACLGLGPASSAFAQQTLYWSGTSGTNAQLWSTLSAWSTLPGSWSQPAAIPDATNNVVFSISSLTTPQDVYLGGRQSAFGLTFSSTSATVFRGGVPGSPATNTLGIGPGGISVGPGTGAIVIGTGSSDNVNVVLNGSQTWDNLDRGRLLIVSGSVAGSATSGNSQTLTVTGWGFTTLGGVLSDGGGGGVLNLTKTGSGALRLGNTANTYSGTTTVSMGTLVISGSGSLGQGNSTVQIAAGAASFSSGRLLLDGSQAPFELSRNLSLTGLVPKTSFTYPGYTLASIGSNTISGTIDSSATGAGTGPGGNTTVIVSNNGTLTMSGRLNLVTGNTLVCSPSGMGNYAVTGVLSGNGALEKQGYGVLFLDPSDSSSFTGILRLGSARDHNTVSPNWVDRGRNSVRVTKNFVIGTRETIESKSDQNDGLTLEVRMDNPLLQTTCSVNASIDNARNPQPTLFVDHGVGSTVTGGTLALGTVTNSLNFASRNGYGVTVGPLVMNGIAGSSYANSLAGLLTITGSTTFPAAATTLAFSGDGNTLLAGNLTGSSATVARSLSKAGAGLLTITSTAATLSGNVAITGGGLALTDFRSVNNIATGTISLGNATSLIIGTTEAPGAAADLVSQRRINVAVGFSFGGAIIASQSGTDPVVLPNVVTSGGSGLLLLGGTSTADNRISSALGSLNPSDVSLKKASPGIWVL